MKMCFQKEVYYNKPLVLILITSVTHCITRSSFALLEINYLVCALQVKKKKWKRKCFPVAQFQRLQYHDGWYDVLKAKQNTGWDSVVLTRLKTIDTSNVAEKMKCLSALRTSCLTCTKRTSSSLGQGIVGWILPSVHAMFSFSYWKLGPGGS